MLRLRKARWDCVLGKHRHACSNRFLLCYIVEESLHRPMHVAVHLRLHGCHRVARLETNAMLEWLEPSVHLCAWRGLR